MSADLRARLKAALAIVEPFDHALTDAVLAEVQAELDAKDTEIAEQTLLAINAENARAYQQRRAEQAEAERDQLKDLNAKLKATIDAFPDANSAANLAHARRERDQLRAAAERVREILDYFDGQIIALESGNPAVGSAFRFTFTKIRAALDQAPAAEPSRCRSCDHLISAHQPDGCWYTVTTGTPSKDLVCACTAPAAESPYASGGEILPRTQGDQIPAQLSGCGFAINPEPAAEQDGGGR